MNKQQLLQHLREEFEDNMDFGGTNWWREDLAKDLEMTPEDLFDRNHDTGLLFELEQDGELRCDWCERTQGTFDYLVCLNGPRIEWD